MAKRKRLTDSFIAGLTEPGTHGDGRGGFGLKVRAHRTTAGHLSRSWTQQVRIGGRVTNLGLGRWPMVSLQEARARALENVAAIYRGDDPRNAPKPVRAASAASVTVPAPSAVVTFGEAFDRMLTLNGKALRPATVAVHRRSFGYLPASFTGADVAGIEAGDVLRVLEPIWLSEPRQGAVADWHHRKDVRLCGGRGTVRGVARGPGEGRPTGAAEDTPTKRPWPWRTHRTQSPSCGRADAPRRNGWRRWQRSLWC